MNLFTFYANKTLPKLQSLTEIFNICSLKNIVYLRYLMSIKRLILKRLLGNQLDLQFEHRCKLRPFE